MKEEKKLFPAQEKSELVLDIIRKHWFSYVPFWFLAVIMTAPLFLGLYFWFGNMLAISPGWQNIIILFVSVYLLFIQGLLIFGFVDFYLDVYIVTDRRIVDISQNGLFKRTISELNLRQIQDVNATVVGFAATLLHFGDVKIQTAGDKPNFVFQAIPHPYEISKKILDLHEAYLQELEKKAKKGTYRNLEKPENINTTKTKEDSEKEDSEHESLDKTLTEKWFDEGSEACYSDESCRQKILEGVNKHLAEQKSTVFTKGEVGASTSKRMQGKIKEKEGELKEGKEVDL